MPTKHVRHLPHQENIKTFSRMRKYKYLLLLLPIIFLSCATKTKIEYVDREVVKHQTQYVHDTLVNNVHDSVYHTIFQKGDTVYNTKYVEHIKWKERIVCQIDTVVHDSVSVQIKENTVKKVKIPNWCYYSLVGWFIILIFAILKIYKWLR